MESNKRLEAEAALAVIEQQEQETIFSTVDPGWRRHGVLVSIVVTAIGCVVLIAFFWLTSTSGMLVGAIPVGIYLAAMITWEKRRTGVSHKPFQRGDLQMQVFKQTLPMMIFFLPMLWGAMWAMETKQPLWVFGAIVVPGMALFLGASLIITAWRTKRDVQQ